MTDGNDRQEQSDDSSKSGLGVCLGFDPKTASVEITDRYDHDVLCEGITPCGCSSRDPDVEPCPECDTGHVIQCGPMERDTGHVPFRCTDCTWTN